MLEKHSRHSGERIAGAVLLVLLGVLAVVVVTRPHYYTVAQVRAVSPEGTVGARSKMHTQPSSAEPLLPFSVPDSLWEREGPPEEYPEDRLYEKIDGLDERYKLYGTDTLLFATYRAPESPDDRADIYLYAMTSVLGALGIFGREKPPGVAVSSDFGQAAYTVPRGIYFRKDRYYVQIRAYSDNAAEPCRQLAAYVDRHIPEGTGEVTSLPFLPKEGRVAGSERFEPTDAVLGTDFLRNVFSADYVAKDAGPLTQPATLFAVNCGTAEQALRAHEQYLEHLSRQGELLRVEKIEGIDVTVMDLDGLYEAFWSQGEIFAGVAEASDQAMLHGLATSLIRTLQGQSVPVVGPRGVILLGAEQKGESGQR